MRKVESSQIVSAVEKIFIAANKILPTSLENLILEATILEEHTIGKPIMNDLCRNMEVAKELNIPICQDTGMAVIFAEIGQDVHIDGDFNEAVNEGVRRAYINGLLRCSVVGDPLERKNTDDNTPAIIHTKLVKGDKIKLTAAPKGFGSENMSRLKMFTPAATRQDIIDFVVETVVIAGSNPCPPIVIGIGIGGDFEYSAVMSKQALCRSVSVRHSNPYYEQMERDILEAVNETGIGPQGFGGKTTALAVNIETYATHIAGLPVAVNIGCHVTRHKSIEI